eukprot:91728_1
MLTLISILQQPQFLTRFLCIIVSIIMNIVLLAISIYKIFVTKQPPFNICTILLISYLLFGILTPFYNVYYRFIIDPLECFLSDSIEESLIVFTRLIIMFFYVSRLHAFKGSSYEINAKILISLVICILSYSIIIPLLWIPQQTVKPDVTHHLGVYCSNTGDFMIICIYYGLDFIVSVFLCTLFVRKLLQVRNKAGIQNTKTENDDITALAKKTLILTTISIVSSWLIVYPSMVLSSTHLLAPLRWFYPLDYGINGLCMFLMFTWKWDMCGFANNCYKSDDFIESGMETPKNDNISNNNVNNISKPSKKLEIEIIPGINVDEMDNCAIETPEYFVTRQPEMMLNL